MTDLEGLAVDIQKSGRGELRVTVRTGDGRLNLTAFPTELSLTGLVDVLVTGNGLVREAGARVRARGGGAARKTRRKRGGRR